MYKLLLLVQSITDLSVKFQKAHSAASVVFNWSRGSCPSERVRMMSIGRPARPASRSDTPPTCRESSSVPVV